LLEGVPGPCKDVDGEVYSEWMDLNFQANSIYPRLDAGDIFGDGEFFEGIMRTGEKSFSNSTRSDSSQNPVLAMKSTGLHRKHKQLLLEAMPRKK